MSTSEQLSLELLQGINEANDKEQSSPRKETKQLESYLLFGRGGQILNQLLALTKQGFACSSQIVHLCVSLVQVLTVFKPTDCKQGEDCLNHRSLYRVFENQTNSSKKYQRNWVKVYNNLTKRRNRKHRKGAKISAKKRRNHFHRYTRLHHQNWNPQLSSDENNTFPNPNPIDSSNVSASRLSFANPEVNSKRFSIFSKYIHSSMTNSCDVTNATGTDTGKTEPRSELPPFEGPFHLATVLLELLESSFCSRYSYSHVTTSATPVDDDSPMSVAVQLVTAITALHQTKSTFVRSNSYDNDKSLSKISFKETVWTVESLSQLQRLVFRTVIVLCHVGLEHGEDVTELVQCQAIESLLHVSTDILRRGGMVPHGTTRQSNLPTNGQNPTTDSHPEKNPEEHGSGDSENSAPKPVVPSLLVNDVGDSCDRESYHEEFRRKFYKMKKQVLLNAESSIPAHMMFVSEVMFGMFGLLTQSLENCPGALTFKQLNEVTSLMHEFHNCNGFDVLSCLLQQVATLSSHTRNLSNTSLINATSSPIKSSMLNGALPSTMKKPETSHYTLFISLLASYERLLTIIQKTKIEYLHKVACSRHHHRSCDLSKLVPIHHDCLGDKATKTLQSSHETSQQHNAEKGCDHLRTVSLASFKDDTSLCVVAAGVHFLLSLATSIKGRSTFAREVLRFLDRIGICRCKPLCSIVVPLLCNLTKWSEKTQNVALAIVGKLFLHHYHDEITTTDNESSSTLTSMHITDTPSAWVEQHTSLNGSTNQEMFFEKSHSTTWRHSYPSDTKLPPSSTNSFFNTDSAEVIMLQHSDLYPWLCLCLYKPLLHSTNVDIALKVALHLQSLSNHLCNPAKYALQTLVLLPILHVYAGSTWEAVDQPPPNPPYYVDDVIFIVLGMLLQYLEESCVSRMLFIRHGGMKALNILLDQDPYDSTSSSGGGSTPTSALVLDLARLVTSKTLPPMTNKANIAIFQPVPARQMESENSGESTSLVTEPRSVRSFFRGISFSWGSDKRRVKEMRDRGTQLDGPLKKESVGPTLSNPTSSSSSMQIDEMAVYLGQVKKFVHKALSLTGASPYDFSKDRLKKTISFVRAVSGVDSTDSESDIGLTVKRKRKLSETSGYRSTSQEQLDHSNERVSTSNQSASSSVVFSTDNLQLPADTEYLKWKKLSDLWRVVSVAVPTDDDLCSVFLDMNGFNVALRLLTLTSVGLSSYFDSEIDFTHPTTVEQSLNDSFAKSASLNSSTDAIYDVPSKSKDPPPRMNSIPRITISSSSHGSNLKKAVSLDNILSETFKIFRSNPNADSAIDTPESVVDVEIHQKILELKLSLFSSCLRTCFFCAKLNDQFDVDANDVISMLQPALRGKISSSTFSRLLHSSLFQAAIQPATDDPGIVGWRLKTVLHGLQRTINSGGSTNKSNSRTNSASYLLSPSASKHSVNGALLNRLNDKLLSSCPPSPARPTEASGSLYATKDEEEETLSDGLSSGGYDGDSESDSCESTAMSSNCRSPYQTPLKSAEDLYEEKNVIKFTNGTLVHPELLLLSIELLSNKKLHDPPNSSNSDTAGEGYDTSRPTLNTRDDIALSVMRGLSRVASFSTDNLNKMSKRGDVVSACLTHFVDYIITEQEACGDHRVQLLSLCKSLNQNYMTADHLRLFLSLFNSNNPPLEPLLTHLLDLVDHQCFGPLWFLPFSWTSPAAADCSDSDDDSCEDDTTTSPPDLTPQHSLTVWKVAPLQMPLENRIGWPPLGGGITVSLWLKVSLGGSSMSFSQYQNWEGHTIIIDSGTKSSPPDHSYPYIHLFSVGSKQTMLQVWMEGTTLIFRVCIDPDDGKPVGLLAQAECADMISPDEWNHLTLTYTEDKMPDKTILGKVHLVLNCFLENDVILEFNLPPPTKSGLSSWRQNQSLMVNLQKVTFFLGHSDGSPTNSEDGCDVSRWCVSVGNILLFNQPHPTCQSAFIINRLGPNASSLTQCLVDPTNKETLPDYRVRFRTTATGSCFKEQPRTGVPPRLFQLLPQALNGDSIADEILLGEYETSPKSLQESLVMSFDAANPSSYHVFIRDPGTTPTRRKMLFRRTTSDRLPATNDVDPLTHCGVGLKVQKAKPCNVRATPCTGINRSLNQVGGISVLLLLYPKIVELTCRMTSQKAEYFQVLALKSLLRLRRTSAEREEEFASGGLSALLHKVMTKKETVIGYYTLQLLFNMACSEDIIIDRKLNDGQAVFQVNLSNTTVIIFDYELLQTFLLDWKLWHKAINQHGEQDFSVWLLLLRGLESLTRDEHQHQWFNSKVLYKAGTVQRILEGFQEMLSEGVSPFPGPEVSMLMVEVIRGVMGSPPEVELLRTLSNFAIAVHPPTGTFVSHSVSSFYFSLENPEPNKSNTRMSIGTVSFAKNDPVAHDVTGPSSKPFNRTLSVPTGSGTGSKPYLVISGDSTDTSTEEDILVAELSPNVFENATHLQPSLLSTASNKNRSLSERHHLTPIKENESRDSPRSRSLDASMNSDPFTGDVPDEGQVEVGKNEEILMTMNNRSDTGNSFTFLSWDNISRPHEDSFMRFYGDESVALLLTECLNILFVAVMTMRDVDVPQLFGESLNPDMIVVLANHASPSVRTAAVRLLAVYFTRCTVEEQTTFLKKKKGFQLVANQLHQHPTTVSIAEACFYLLLGHAITLDEALPLDGSHSLPISHDAFTNHAAILLLAILEKSYWPDTSLCCHLLARMSELFEFVGPIADIMLDNGLALALCNLFNVVCCDVSKKLTTSDKKLLYRSIEDFLSCIAIKACVTSGTGHIQIFEDMIILMQAIENRATKLFRDDWSQVEALKEVATNILFKVMDAMQPCTGGKPQPVVKRQDSFESSSLGVGLASNPSRPDTLKLSPERSIISSALFDPDSPTLSDTSERNGSIPVSPHIRLSHQRSRSMGTGSDMFPVPSPTLTRGRHYASKHTRYTSVGGESRSSAFRPRTNALRTRSFRGNQRRRVNEGETATRLQRLITIIVNRAIFTDKHFDLDTNASIGGGYSFFATSPLSSPSHVLNDLSEEDTSSINSKDTRSFSQTAFDIFMEWLFLLVETTDLHQRRGSQSSAFSWERILHLSQSVLVDQTCKLFIHLLSPQQVSLQCRTYPLYIVNHHKIEALLNILLPAASPHGKKVVICLHYLLTCYKQQLNKQEKHDGRKLLKLISKIGHRVSSHHRRALQEASGDGDPQSPCPVEEFQEQVLKEHRKAKSEWTKMNSSIYRLLHKRTSSLADHVSKQAMEMTQVVVLQQNIQRKKIISRMKDCISKDLYIRKKWTKLLEKLAHERAVWYNPEQYPRSWQLDPTEGPFRERRRLQRCHTGIDQRFLLKQKSMESNSCQEKGNPLYEEERQSAFIKSCATHARPLAFLFEDDLHSSDAFAIRSRLQSNDHIIAIQNCINVTAACETAGELLIGGQNMYFVGDQPIVDPSLTQTIFGEREIMSLSWERRDVVEFHKRWWQLRDTAIEIFLSNGTTYLLAFKTIFEREKIYDEMVKLDLPNLRNTDDFHTLTKSWCAGKMTNYEYLIMLNKTAGRSFNDLMQYPVMPFVLADYTSQVLDLDAPSSFRNLGKPISVQDSNREQHFRDRYRFLEEDYKNCTEDEREMKTPPFHYGSHYSNSGTVLHFLVRLPPFTQLFLEYQDSSFDIPDRTFHSMETTYRLSSYASTTDVKELIPEFFFLPEFLCNLEGFDFGLRQCGIRVHHVTLPLWCREDPRLFVLIHRQALENDFVSEQLHKWVDLVFGYKQMGQAALDAVNVFHPATYFGTDVASVEDPVKRKALETMVKTYGQTPKMLFWDPHPARCLDSPPGRAGEILPSSILGSFRSPPDTKAYRRIKNSKVPRPISSVKGLQWGDYVGSPSAPEPVVFLHNLIQGPIGELVPLETNDVCALAPKIGLLVVYTRDKQAANGSKPIDINWSALFTYNNSDNIIRLKLKHDSPGINLARFSPDNHVTCCVATPDCRSLILGSRSGIVFVQKCNPMPDKTCDIELLSFDALYCHTAPVTRLSVCGAFRIFVSASEDGTATIWDLDSLSYIRSLTGHAGPVTALAISQTSGDICTVCDSGQDSGSQIRLWTVNGSLVAAQDCRFRVRCVAFSNAPEGVSINVVAGGLENGTVRLWSSWDLTHVRDLKIPNAHQPVTSITFTHNSMVLYAATAGNMLFGWCRKDKEKDKQPLLITFVNPKTAPVT